LCVCIVHFLSDLLQVIKSRPKVRAPPSLLTALRHTHTKCGFVLPLQHDGRLKYAIFRLPTLQQMQNSAIDGLFISIIITNIDFIVIFVAETLIILKHPSYYTSFLLSDISSLKLLRRYFIENQLVTFMLKIRG
jgi:hypothetical protein